MAVILMHKDPFVDLDQRLADPSGGMTNLDVRRPVYGIHIKEPRFAYISLYQDVGDDNPAQAVSLINSSSSGGFSDLNHNFILQTVVESRDEKVQVVETFGDHFAFFYGQKPVILQVQGMLFNTEGFNWKNEFLANYQRLLRGTKCVENRTRVYLGWDDVIAEGYILNTQISYDKDLPLVVPFSFNMLLNKPPMDLSRADAALDNPGLDSDTPTTYRYIEEDETDMPEYLTGRSDSDKQFVTFDPATGLATATSTTARDALTTSDTGNAFSEWADANIPDFLKDADRALMDTEIALRASGSGRDTTTQALRSNADPSIDLNLLAQSREQTEALASLVGDGSGGYQAVIDFDELPPDL